MAEISNMTHTEVRTHFNTVCVLLPGQSGSSTVLTKQVVCTKRPTSEQ